MRELVSSRESNYAIRNTKGFTLIELAIVLVIIGIIIGAVLKGQDLIDGARAKKFVNDTKKWEIMTWTFMDRKGRMPGDGGSGALGKNGIIGDDPTALTGEQLATTNGAYELTTATFVNPPTNPVTVGSLSFYVYLGNDNGATKKNALVICGAVACATAFTADQLKFIEAFDASFDGVSDAGMGNVRAATAVTCTPTPCAQNASAVTAITDVGGAAPGTATVWNTSTHVAAAYYFDRPR